MTDKELKDYGYNPQICKIGILYSKDNFFVILKSDGSVDFRLREDDMNSRGIAKSITELKNLEKQYYIDKAEHYRHLVKLYSSIADNYGN